MKEILNLSSKPCTEHIMYICEPIITGHFGVVILVIVQTMQLYLKNAVIFATYKCIYPLCVFV